MKKVQVVSKPFFFNFKVPKEIFFFLPFSPLKKGRLFDEETLISSYIDFIIFSDNVRFYYTNRQKMEDSGTCD